MFSKLINYFYSLKRDIDLLGVFNFEIFSAFSFALRFRKPEIADESANHSGLGHSSCFCRDDIGLDNFCDIRDNNLQKLDVLLLNFGKF